MINLTADDIVAIGKANLARNVCDLATNELFGLPECNGKSWSKEFLRFLVLDAYDSCPGKKAKGTIIIPPLIGGGTVNSLPFSYYALLINGPYDQVNFHEGTYPFPVAFASYSLQHVVDRINDPTYGKGYIAEVTGPYSFDIFAPDVGAIYNGASNAFVYLSAWPPPIFSLSIPLTFSGGVDPVSKFDQKTTDCYYSVLNT